MYKFMEGNNRVNYYWVRKMDFEDSEGFKRIKNIKNLGIDKVADILDEYENEMGKINYNISLDTATINVDIDGKYDATIKIDGDFIIIERNVESGSTATNLVNNISGKPLVLARADRMIEQIYDLINDYMDDGVITEHITSVKKIVTMTETKKKLLAPEINLKKDNQSGKSKIKFGLGETSLVIGREFQVEDEDGTTVYTIKDNIVSSYFSIRNIVSGNTEYSVDYSSSKSDIYKIKKGYSFYEFKLDKTTPKIRFISNNQKEEIKVSADYTNNHYLLEVNEIVIGAIDCTDSIIKENYKIEINDESQMDLIISIAILLDVYNRKNNNSLE